MSILRPNSDVGTPTSPERSAWSRRRGRMLANVRTGILGGTFDPIHIAHLHAGETAMFAADLDRVLFMPAGKPWQKGDRELTPAIQRLEMTRLAIGGIDRFEIDDREIDRVGPTYTIDSLLSFPAEEELFLILGADAALGLPTWHRWEAIIERVRVLVVPRPGTDLAAVAATVPTATILDMSALDVSSTSIRHLAASGRPFRFLVPPEVHRFIEDTGIYTQT
ncbi:MAG: nicotinate-nucleotide adenylyltransferase [Acidimicrobiia bacterium]